MDIFYFSMLWSPVARSSYLHNRISYTGKMTSLYWIRAQVTNAVANATVGIVV